MKCSYNNSKSCCKDKKKINKCCNVGIGGPIGYNESTGYNGSSDNVTDNKFGWPGYSYIAYKIISEVVPNLGDFDVYKSYTYPKNLEELGEHDLVWEYITNTNHENIQNLDNSSNEDPSNDDNIVINI